MGACEEVSNALRRLAEPDSFVMSFPIVISTQAKPVEID